MNEPPQPLPTMAMTEFRQLVERMIIRSLGIPRSLIAPRNQGECHGHAMVTAVCPSIDFYTHPGDRVLVDGFERAHVLFGKTGANGFAVQLEYQAGRPVFDWKHARIKRRLIQGVVVYIKS